MRVLVTGGAGYIGSVTVEELLAAGAEVAVFDNLTLGHREAVHPRAKLFVGDLSDRAAIDEAFGRHRPEAVMHFAALSLVGASMCDPGGYLRTNFLTGMNLIEAAVRHGVRRFILSSTAALFDRPDETPISEEAAIRPGSPYGESKFFLERALHWFDRIHALRFATLRYFNAAGASQQRGEDHRPETHLVPIALEVAMGRREKLTIFGDDYPTPDGTCVRDYVHVSDLAQAHVLALAAIDQKSRTYNLGIGRGFSVRQVAAAARDVTGREVPVEIGPRREGDCAELVAGSDRIRRELGWHPRYTDLHEIVATAWRWRQLFPDGYSTPVVPPPRSIKAAADTRQIV